MKRTFTTSGLNLSNSMDSKQGQQVRPGSSVLSSFPCLLPEDPALFMNHAEFEAYISKILPRPATENEGDRMHLDEQNLTQGDAPKKQGPDAPKPQGQPYADALNSAAEMHLRNPAELSSKNRALTENLGVTFKSTESPLVDLFHTLDGEWTQELEDKLITLLEASWKEDPLACLKLIWNTRSIHLGKGNRHVFYMALGWLKERHPRTLLINLQWLFRGVIEKDNKPRADKDQAVVEQVASSVDDHEVVHGVSHGYWKDLVNILALSANGKLNMSDPRKILLTRALVDKKDRSKFRERWYRRKQRQRRVSKMGEDELKEYISTREDRINEALRKTQMEKLRAKERRHGEESARHETILEKLSTDPFHRALHLTVARLFAEQLKKDMSLLETGTKKQQREVSLCAKWAPSVKHFHDRHTRVTSTIAEILFPHARIGREGESRELYLKRARDQYRYFATSKLRKALQVVERDISANTFSNIKYERVPSLAMDQYKELFAKKDHDRYEEYLLAVEQGKLKISGAVLTPGTMVHQASALKAGDILQSVVNSQWKTLVQRIKDCGSLSGSIAMCDVSGSMTTLAPGSRKAPHTLMDTAMGLSLIISEATKPPFGGRIITFSQKPQVVMIGGEDDPRQLTDQVAALERVDWQMNTDFMKAFDLLLSIAQKHQVKPEDMVKRIFVFSDMEFDTAQRSPLYQWATHHQIVVKKYEAAGYEVPELVYWNLSGRPRSHAPVTHDMPGTALFTGQNQAMIKVFLENGSLEVEESEEEMEVDVKEGEDWDMVDKKEKKQKQKMTPFLIMKKAINHKAYEMLEVVD